MRLTFIRPPVPGDQILQRFDSACVMLQSLGGPPMGHVGPPVVCHMNPLTRRRIRCLAFSVLGVIFLLVMGGHSNALCIVGFRIVEFVVLHFLCLA